jgi:hypothetical protein
MRRNLNNRGGFLQAILNSNLVLRGAVAPKHKKTQPLAGF